MNKLLVTFLMLLSSFSFLYGQREQFEFKIQDIPESNDSTWGIYVRPQAGFVAGSNDAIVGSGQITILMFDDGMDFINNIQSVSGVWSPNYDKVESPCEAPGISYLFIGLQDGEGILLEDGKETLLFTFQIPTGCPDTLGLLDNNTDPFMPHLSNNCHGSGIGHNSEWNNPRQDLSVFNTNTGRIYDWYRNYAPENYSCGDCNSDFSFNCPSDTLVSCSIIPDSIGYPVVNNQCLLDTIYYSDNNQFETCSDTTITFFRNWFLKDTSGQRYNCKQEITILKDFSKIKFPTDTILNYCEYKDNLDNSITGYPIYLGEKLSTEYYQFGLIIIQSDVILSKFQRRRYFKILDWCNPAVGPIVIGSQLITLATETPDASNMPCYIAINKEDTISFQSNLPINTGAYRYNYLGDCKIILGNNPRFMDEGLTNANYTDNTVRKDTVEICAEGKVVVLAFTEFELTAGDTLFAYRGNLDALRKENAPNLLKASGDGVPNAYGGWIASSDDAYQNDSGCLTFIFETNGDGQTGIGWDSYWDCVDFTCPADTTVEESLLPKVTGYPIFTKRDNLVDTLFYKDVYISPICVSTTNNLLERTWTIHYKEGISKTCKQNIAYTQKEIADIQIPQNKTISDCLKWSELRDLDITGRPTLYDVPLAEDEYIFGMLIMAQDSVISNRQVKRKFVAFDWCKVLGPIPIGDQLISFPSTGDEDNDTVIDCMDLCFGGDDRINSDGLGMPDDCDCDPNNPDDEFIEVNQALSLNEELVDSTYHASFQISSNGNLTQGDFITFYAGHTIILKAGFHAPLGSRFIAEIDQDCSTKNSILDNLSISRTINLNKQDFSTKTIAALEMSIFPNPSKGNTTISYFLPTRGDIKLTLYNSWGGEISVLQNENLPEGSHQTTLINENLATGTYYITLQTAKEISTKKFLILETK